MSWEDTNPPERDEPEFCDGCGAPVPEERMWVCEDCERSFGAEIVERAGVLELETDNE